MDIIHRFHPRHGENIDLSEDNTVASRKRSFSGGVVFSQQPLSPGEVFLIEIERTDSSWNGFLRFGLSQLDPNKVPESSFPTYSLPDLLANPPTQSSWIFVIKGDGSDLGYGLNDMGSLSDIYMLPVRQNDYFCKCSRFSYTSKGMIANNHFRRVDLPENARASDEGTRVGVVYVPLSTTPDSNVALMYFIVNGKDLGPCVFDIPYKEKPLYAIVDVYGCTKQVRIVQIYSNDLKSLCRNVILNHLKGNDVSKLPLPTSLKDYLSFRS